MKPLKSTPIPDEVPARRYWPARRAILRILMPVLRLLYGFRVVGDQTMCSAPGPFVVVCNHVHTLDCVMVSKAFEQKRQWVLSLPSNLELPVAGAIVRVMGGIPVPDRPAGYRVLYRMLEEVFARGEFFQVYPEGELLPGCRTLRSFHPGAFLFAVRSGCLLYTSAGVHGIGRVGHDGAEGVFLQIGHAGGHVGLVHRFGRAAAGVAGEEGKGVGPQFGGLAAHGEIAFG